MSGETARLMSARERTPLSHEKAGEGRRGENEMLIWLKNLWLRYEKADARARERRKQWDVAHGACPCCGQFPRF